MVASPAVKLFCTKLAPNSAAKPTFTFDPLKLYKASVARGWRVGETTPQGFSRYVARAIPWNARAGKLDRSIEVTVPPAPTD